MKVDFSNLGRQWSAIKEKAIPRLEELMMSSQFIGGNDIDSFERNFASYIGSNFAVGTSSGTDAIKLALKSLDLKGSIGIILPANTFIATILGAEEAYPDAEFILVDCNEYYQIDVQLLENVITENRHRWNFCVVIPVHLYGHPCDMDSIYNICLKNMCHIVEDASQAHGSEINGSRQVGSFGSCAAFSLYPGKNLGACGDAGVITTNDPEIRNRLKLLRNYGSAKKYQHDMKGYNNRLDTIQAIIVDEKLHHLDEWNKLRNRIASIYDNNINSNFTTPKIADYCKTHVYHIYPVRISGGGRDEFMAHLRSKGIDTGIHYPTPIEQTGAYKYLNLFNQKTRSYAKQLVSLPINPFMTEVEAEYVCNTINRWK
jgi:dTDP-4-amino-4,6-dideoxygalactose transaminase